VARCERWLGVGSGAGGGCTAAPVVGGVRLGMWVVVTGGSKSRCRPSLTAVVINEGVPETRGSRAVRWAA
jgi:hypothetical protein